MSRPRQVLTIAEGVELAFRLIPAGTFRMGQRGINSDEEPVHWVRITRDFWMMETPVTQVQFAAWKRDHKNHFAGKPEHPVEQVTWHDAVDFAASSQSVVPVGWIACLPTEAEWEYACRAGTTTQYHSGDRKEDLKKIAWFDEELYRGSTHPVRAKGETSANDFGLFDMHGNVWEWCFDEYDSEAYRLRIDGVADPGWSEREAFYSSGRKSKLIEDASRRVLRGGAWYNSAANCRAAWRDRYYSVDRYGIDGFRLVLVSGSPASGSETRAAEPEGKAGGRGTSTEAVPEGRRGRKAWLKIF